MTMSYYEVKSKTKKTSTYFDTWKLRYEANVWPQLVLAITVVGRNV